MKISPAKKQKLLSLLGPISTSAEKQEMQRLDALKIKEITEFFEKLEEETENKIDAMGKSLAATYMSFENYRKASEKHSRYMLETFGTFSDAMVKKIGDLGGTITTSYEQNKPINTAGVYKDMINQLSQVNKSIIDKPVPVWNWPQYASVGVRNKNFENVNPATEESSDWGAGYENQKITLDSVGKIAYIAGAEPGTAAATPTWQACKINYSDLTNITIQWANGSQDFNNSATDLTALTYS